MRNPCVGVVWCGREEAQGHYECAVREAGGTIRRILPGEDPEEVIAEIDGLLLTGGVDVDPTHYGQEVHVGPDLHQAVVVDARRDALELPLARLALARGVPVLGICRGIQVLSVAAGGDLVQDTSLLGLPPGAHDQTRRTPPLPPEEAGHVVRVKAGTRLRAIIRTDELPVNTLHHQVLGRIAPSFEVVATAPDGVVEAIESADGFALGVQWHPERMVRRDPVQHRLFQLLVRACALGRLP
jgi:putative glutamine amidotransferase